MYRNSHSVEAKIRSTRSLHWRPRLFLVLFQEDMTISISRIYTGDNALVSYEVGLSSKIINNSKVRTLQLQRRLLFEAI